jgi:hypothetical protein
MESTSRQRSAPVAAATAGRRGLRAMAAGDVVNMPHTRAARTRHVAAEPVDAGARAALEAVLQTMAPSSIAVIGRHADAVTAWLRHTGRDAEVLALPAPAGARPRASRHRGPRRVVVAIEFLEHEADAAESLRGIRRGLGREDRLVAVVPNPTHASVRLAMLLGRHPAYFATAAPAGRPLTAADVERVLDDAGYLVSTVERQVDSPAVLKEIGSLVPPPVLDMLAGEADALTSHFVFVAVPEGPATVGILHRRMREFGDALCASTRGAEGLALRMADVERQVQLRQPDAAAPPPAVPAADPAALDRIRTQLLTREAELRASIARIEQSRYQRLVLRIHEVVAREIPPGSTVAVVSRGDDALAAFETHRGSHFPQTEGGVYAGHHPADSAAAIAHLDELRGRGVRYLVVPRTAFWWFDHYRGLTEHLAQSSRSVFRDRHTCAIFALRGGRKSR